MPFQPLDFIKEGGFMPVKATTPTSLLETAKTPDYWVDVLKSKGIEISERTLRERANKLGACIRIARSMLITPDHIEQILEAGQKKCRSNPTSEATNGGRKAGSNTRAGRSRPTSSGARELLQKKLQNSGASTRKNG